MCSAMLYDTIEVTWSWGLSVNESGLESAWESH
jgi:hypothetical protein